MSATIQAAKVAQVPSNYEAVREGAVKAANWLGRQVQFIGSTASNCIAKIASWVKPFFSSIKKMALETFDRSREFFVANKNLAIPAAVIGVIMAIVLFTIDRSFCSEQAAVQTPVK